MGGKMRRMPQLAAAFGALLLASLFPGCSTTVHRSATACMRAKVGGKVVCLAPGKRCSARHERVYRSYGLTCRKGVLRERSYIGPANP
jgi:hypothetical protein